MKTSILTMVMIVLTSLNINAKTNSNSWRNNGKNNNTVVVVNNCGNHSHDGHYTMGNHSHGGHSTMGNDMHHGMDKGMRNRTFYNNRHMTNFVVIKHNKHNKMYNRHHNCVLDRCGKNTYVCRICGTHYGMK